MATSPLTYTDVIDAISKLYNVDQAEVIANFNSWNVDITDIKQTFKMLEGTPYELWYNADGTVRSAGYHYATAATSPAYETAKAVNSNAVLTKTNVKMPVTISESATTAGKSSFSAGLSTAGNFIMKEVVPAVAAAGVGISLGKAIDSTLYNANPDFWDAHGMSGLNPETWASITAGDDSLGATMFNLVFGIDTESGESQAYLDQDALAYLALYMQQQGVFDESARQEITDRTVGGVTFENTITKYNGGFNYKGRQGNTSFDGSYSLYYEDGSYWAIQWYNPSSVEMPTNVSFCMVTFNERKTIVIASNEQSFANLSGWGPFIIGTITAQPPLSTENGQRTRSLGISSYTYNDQTVYYFEQPVSDDAVPVYVGETTTSLGASEENLRALAWLLVYGDAADQPSVPGITNQVGGITPDLSNANTVAEVLQALQEQYPGMFSNAVTQTTVQPDGSEKTYTYVPIGFPDVNSVTDTQPTTGTTTQSNPEINPETAPQALLDNFVDTITDYIDPNTPITGEGAAPAIVTPSATGSALYSIYNPSISEINAFGAWLWSSSFVDQLLKLFNDPMQAIIGLHKVFATPVISGTGSIKVGYLDSGVTANLVSDQYTTIDCGTVALNETFNNIFDYSPYTKVSLYLPFIGIVNLDAGEVMRGSINVKYSVDVISGACLAEVRITRDGGGGVLYTFTGDCKVTYPISSGSYMGIVASLASIAGGVASTIASGGAALPMVAGAVGGAMNAHTQVQHSGSISGNAGAMGCKIPYLIITRPQTNVARNADHMQGKGANNYRTLSSCNGFVKISDVHLSGIVATESELSEISALLKGGVLV